MIEILLLFAGFILLIYGAGLLVDSASALAKSLNIPNIVIGLTIVAFGTSAPELIVNVFAAIQQSSAIALGNVAGSNIFNILAILGISTLVYPMVVKSNTTWIEIPLALLAAIVMFVMAADAWLDPGAPSLVSRADGIVLLLFFAIFLAYNIQLARKGDQSEELNIKSMSRTKSVLLIMAGLAMLVGGGRLIVTSATELAISLGLSERVIALTIISAGTSLPELATSVVAAFKKNTDIAIGNIVGSNIFNVFLILGTTAVIRPVTIAPGAGLDLTLHVLASLLLLAFVFRGKGRRIDRAEGAVFVLLYVSYLVYLVAF